MVDIKQCSGWPDIMCVTVEFHVSRQRVADLEQQLENVTEENEKLSEQMERRDMQVLFGYFYRCHTLCGLSVCLCVSLLGIWMGPSKAAEPI